MRRFGSVVVSAGFGVVCCVGVLAFSLAEERRFAVRDFQGNASHHLELINADLRESGRFIDSFRNYLDARDHPVTRSNFARYATALHHKLPGLRDIGWAPRVMAADRDDFERAVRADGVSTFQITESDGAGKLVRAAARPVYYPIVSIDAAAQKTAIIGFDLASEPLRRAAIERAIATGLPAATPPLRLNDPNRPQNGVLSFASVHSKPNHDPQAENDAPSQDSGAPDSLVFGAFEVPGIVDTIMSSTRELAALNVYLFNPAGPVGDRLVYWQSSKSNPRPQPSEAVARAQTHWEGTISLMDQPIGAILLPPTDLSAVVWTPYTTLPFAGSVLLSGAAVGFCLVSLRRKGQLDALVRNLQEASESLHGDDMAAPDRAALDQGPVGQALRLPQPSNDVGRLARTVAVFKAAVLETARLRAEQAQNQQQAEAAKRAALAGMADAFDRNVGGIVATVSSAAIELQQTAKGMVEVAHAALRQSGTVAAASGQTSANVGRVAAAADELAASVNRIDVQAEHSAQIAEQAVEQARRTGQNVQGLAEAARRVGDVVQLIAGIAAKTRLLALNATIEAARAGGAGAGFAVVASEVKLLAKQTAQATEDIRSQIGAMQHATGDAIGAIGSIEQTIQDMAGIATLIAAAVEQQGAATGEIAQNVREAANRTTEASANIAGVTQSTSATGVAAAQVLSAAVALGQQAVTLKAEVAYFLVTVRAA